MPHYRYFIVGGGMTADAAVRGIREIDSKGSIGLLGREPHPPYYRPPLSKKLWQGKPLDSVWCKTEDLDVTLLLGRQAMALDLPQKRVVDDQGTAHTFDRLLLATGGVPRRFSFGGDGILYFRTLDDYQKLRALSETRRRFAVIGGGFIGSEIAAALAMNGKEVVMAFPEEGIGARAFPGELSQFLNRYYGERGVEVLPRHTVTEVRPQGDGWAVVLRDAQSALERVIQADGLVAGIGIAPETTLAEAAGLAVTNGVVVDEFLRAGHPDVYAAGDVANFYNPALGERLRVEHEDNALTMGRQAGRNMAGEAVPYHHLPYFYSDLFDLGYEAVGQLDARFELHADWREPYREGIVYYLHGGRVRGVLLWNVWDKVPAARTLIAEPGPFPAEYLKGRL
ncbi:NAD(P)/FAD-dependent oxidoreductase [Candidatus Methylocalor cossyra]|uniref:Ferredoxin reductase n=1 Tax=Candidatus Methylocalor cossyra TaxID=3108543 RepID=A0ABM9NH45_9GAMM